jgi:hypothetical protein
MVTIKRALLSLDIDPLQVGCSLVILALFCREGSLAIVGGRSVEAGVFAIAIGSAIFLWLEGPQLLWRFRGRRFTLTEDEEIRHRVYAVGLSQPASSDRTPGILYLTTESIVFQGLRDVVPNTLLVPYASITQVNHTSDLFGFRRWLKLTTSQGEYRFRVNYPALIRYEIEEQRSKCA